MNEVIKKFKNTFSEITKNHGLSIAVITGIITIPMLLAFICLILGVIGTVFAGLWNMVMPEVFAGVGPLTWIQGIIIIVLIKIICSI